MSNPDPRGLICCFCGASEFEVAYVIGGKNPEAHICDQCLDEAAEQLHYARILAAFTHPDTVH